MSTNRSPARSQSGLTLIELIIFILIVSVALAGVLTVLDITVKSSADPMIRKQMLTIAEALLEEVELLPFTWCDPSDTNAATATDAKLSGTTIPCASLVQSFGQRSLQTRPLASAPNTYTMNNVANYCAIPTAGGTSCASLSLAGPIPDITQINTAPADYSATIALTAEPLGPVAAQIVSGNPAGVDDASAMNVLRIAVTVTHGSDSIVLEGYRTRHSPNFF
ncbi:MAG: prepilin-type N-terminal cleavage/methylation domain-containing protein [Proteobacteria bacterium]|nr:prepilin-type N-terminal cleavage/methylation domain-containing protein [Pseudomonadota bacterium]